MKDFNKPPYFDDYNENKQFDRILFVPGRAVQTRELTQLQTILQKQVSRLGDFNFEEGSLVTGGNTEIDLDYNFVKLDSLSVSASSLKDSIDSKVVIAKGQTSGITAYVVNVVEETGSDPATIFVKYNDSSDNNTGKTFSAGEQINLLVFDAQDYESNGLSSSVENTFACTVKTGAGVTGKGSAVSISDGVRYVMGFFVLVKSSTLIINKYNAKPSATIGLEVVEDLITPEEDQTLLDNASGSNNESAPGAHRYRITLKLKIKDGSESSNFIELIQLEDGQILQDYRQKELAQPGIAKELATRTYDQSGNFAAKDFEVLVREHLKQGNNNGKYTSAQGGDDSKFVVQLDKGRAYVSGFEITTTGSEFVDFEKSRDTDVFNNSVVPASLGSYCYIDNVYNIPDLTEFQTVQLLDMPLSSYGTVAGGATVIGTARARSIELYDQGTNYQDAVYKLYIFDVKMNSGKSFDDVQSLSQNTPEAFYADVDATKGLLSRQTGAAVKKIPLDVLKSITDITYSSRRVYSTVASENSSAPNPYTNQGSVTITLSGTELFESTDNADYIVVYKEDGASVVQGQIADLSGSEQIVVNGNSLTIYGLDLKTGAADISVDVYVTLTKTTAPAAKTKRKFPRSFLATSPGSSDIQLDRADVVSIESVIDVDSGQDISSRYILDDGQRDSYYDRGRLLFKSGAIAPTGDVSVEFTYYNHGSGDFFSVNSYPETDYENIGTYTTSSGEEISLRDAIDFRPVINNAGTGFTGVGSSNSELFKPNSSIRGDVEYYLSRIDKLAIDDSGNFYVVEGSASLNPKEPKDPESGMVLYKVEIPAYTFDVSDIKMNYNKIKRYTMEDVGKLEERVEKLEYYTSLNLLESETQNKSVTDDAGNERFKNGFLVDNFSGSSVGDSKNIDYSVSIDQDSQEMRPSVLAEGADLELYTDESQNITVKNGIVTLPFTEKTFISQLQSSRATNINPYAIFSWEGNVDLTPSRDTWLETKQAPTVVINNNDQFDSIKNRQDTSLTFRVSGTQIIDPNWNSAWSSAFNWWQKFWSGVNQNTKTVSVQNNSIRRVIGDRIVSVDVVPVMRSIEIEFEAKRLRPNCKVYAYFDDINVTSYVTPSELITDENGSVSGTFTIPDPNISGNPKFRTGERIFRLIDSTSNDVGGSTTLAQTTFSSNGRVQTRQKTIVSTRIPDTVNRLLGNQRTLTRNSLSSSALSQRIRWSDPLAQSFLIEENGGCFLTNIELFFQSKDPSVPVTLEIREMENGIPTQNVIPNSQVTLNPADVTASDDASVGTKFEFDAPVLLQEGSEYCFVLLANSTRYNIYTSKLGEISNENNQAIAKQPYVGVMFKSQNSSTWSVQQLEDIKFNISKAVFDTSVQSEVIIKNKDVPQFKLSSSPIKTENGSDVVTVYQLNHGFPVGSEVVLSGLTDVAGLTLNGQWTVTSSDLDFYTITADSTANATAQGGGENGYASQNYPMDILQPVIQEVILSGTSSSWYVKTSSGKSANGDSTQVPYVKDTAFSRINIQDNTVFDKPRLIASYENERLQPDMNKERSIEFKGVLSTSNPNISPMVDVEKMTAIAVSNRINYPTDISDELNSEGGPVAAKYITKRIALNDPSVGFKIYFNCNRPQGSDVDVYVKLQESEDQAFDSIQYQKIEPTVYPSPNSSTTEFSEYQYELDPGNEFIAHSVKIVLRSNNSAQVPRVKKFRTIALGT